MFISERSKPAKNHDPVRPVIMFARDLTNKQLSCKITDNILLQRLPWPKILIIHLRINQLGLTEGTYVLLAGKKCCYVFFSVIFTGPPDAPFVTNIAVDGKQCSLQWTKPYNGESPIVKYTVYIWVSTAMQGSRNKELANSWHTTNSSYTLDLEWAQNYTASVTAWNRYGESSLGLKRQFTTEKAPQGI